MNIIGVAFILASAVLATGCATLSRDIAEEPLVENTHNATASGDLNALQRILEGNPALANAVSKKDGKTPLHLAAFSGHTEAVLLLLKYKSVIDVRDKFGGTPLQGAAYSGHTEIARLLIEQGADRNALDHDGNSILDATAYQHHCVTASYLLEKGAAADGGKTGFFPINQFISAGDVDCTKIFIAHGASLKNRDKNGFTAMHWLAKGRYVSKQELLATKLYLGREVAPPTSSSPPRYQEIFGLLVAAGGNLNARSNLQETPLHVAAAADNQVVVEALVAAGADINARERHAQTPLVFAARNDRTEIVRFLVSKKADVNASDKNGFTPLIAAIRWGNHMGDKKAEIGEIAYLLVDGGADVNAWTPGGGWGAAGTDGQTALQQAAEFGYADVADLLISRGADVNREFKDGRTPLYWAAKNGHVEIVAMLISNGANVNAKASGRSALSTAREEKRDEIYELLVKHGASE